MIASSVYLALAAQLLLGSSGVDAAATGKLQSQIRRDASATEVDVVVVGGGFSGMMSAYTLDQAGFSTVVLEAKEVIGGRSRSVQRSSGPGIIELGATWINKITQPVSYGLTQKFGLDTAEQYTDGDFLFEGADGRVLRLPPGTLVNTDNETLAVLEGQLVTTIEETADAWNVREFDWPEEEDVTVEKWLDAQGLYGEEHLRVMASNLVSALVGREPREVGIHYMLDYIKSGGGLLNLSGEGTFGAQSLKIKQGTTSLVTNMAEALKHGSVHVNTPVESITQGDDSVLITTGTGQSFRARRAIIAIPTNTYADVAFSPALPCKKNTITSQTKPGIYAKMIINYAEPWWRNAGLVGKFTSHVGPVSFSWETSDVELSQYSLAIFVAGDKATRWHSLPEDEKEHAVLEHLAFLVGEDLADSALNPIEINYVEWTLEEYLWGAPTSSMGPGFLRQYGQALREPFGNLYFAGGEMAYEWKGYLEGALRAGIAAAEDVEASLLT